MIWAVVKFKFEGFHRWKKAPEFCKFLRNKHRHIFHCKVWVEVNHVERDIEFITFKNELKKMKNDFHKINDSCETMAIRIQKYVQKNYPDRQVKVEVFEDGENGAVVE